MTTIATSLSNSPLPQESDATRTAGVSTANKNNPIFHASEVREGSGNYQLIVHECYYQILKDIIEAQELERYENQFESPLMRISSKDEDIRYIHHLRFGLNDEIVKVHSHTVYLQNIDVDVIDSLNRQILAEREKQKSPQESNF